MDLATLSRAAEVTVVSHTATEKAARKQITVDSLLQDSSKFIHSPGIHILYMPKVEDFFDERQNPIVANQLAKEFCIPSWFFQTTGWDANGFCGSQVNPLQEESSKSYSIFTRFLTKHVYYKGDKRRPRGDPATPEVKSLKLDYEWSFMAFFALWRSSSTADKRASDDEQSPPQSPDKTLLLFCFDLSDQMALTTQNLLSDLDLTAYVSDPFTIFGRVCQAVTQEFDDALWSFRPLTRFDFAEEYTVDLAKLNDRYAGIHELSRHTLHVTETLEVASRMLEALLKDSKSFSLNEDLQAATSCPPDIAEQTTKDLQLWSGLMANLKGRAQAFADRLKNEAQLSSNIAAAYDAKVLAFLQQSRAEGQSLTDTVALLTLLFLPGTFVAGFFGMNFFDLNSGAAGPAWTFTNKLWVYFATTIPLTILSLFIFTLDLNLIVWIKQHVTFPLENLLRRSGTSSIQRSLSRQSTNSPHGTSSSLGRSTNNPSTNTK